MAGPSSNIDPVAAHQRAPGTGASSALTTTTSPTGWRQPKARDTADAGVATPPLTAHPASRTAKLAHSRGVEEDCGPGRDPRPGDNHGATVLRRSSAMTAAIATPRLAMAGPHRRRWSPHDRPAAPRPPGQDEAATSPASAYQERRCRSGTA
jgi:hypothetical protein